MNGQSAGRDMVEVLNESEKVCLVQLNVEKVCFTLLAILLGLVCSCHLESALESQPRMSGTDQSLVFFLPFRNIIKISVIIQRS